MDVSCGEWFVIALDSEGCLYSFGQNDFGELGTGDFEIWTLPNHISELNWRFIDNVKAGSNFVIALGWKKTYLKETKEKSSSPLRVK